jgi:Protein of unknown function (DUF2568)
MTTTLAAVRFVLEITAVVALAVAGAHWSWILAVVLPLALIIVWGALIAPKAARRLPDPLRLVVEIVLFAATGLALVAADRAGVGLALAASSIVVAIALRLTSTPA